MFKTKNKYNEFRKKPLEQRLNEASIIKSKYPDRIPVYVHRSEQANRIISDIDKNKYLVPNELSVGQFMNVIRKRLGMNNHSIALFFITNNIIPKMNIQMETLYNEQKEEDGFLYILYTGENTFG